MVKIKEKQGKSEKELLIIEQQPSTIVSNGLEIRWIRFRVLAQLLRIFNARVGNPFATFKAVKGLRKKFKSIQGEKMLVKLARVDGKYFWKLGSPSFPSEASRSMQRREAESLLFDQPYNGLRTLFIAITKKCTLHCEHCFEWDNLNQPEKLSDEDLIELVLKYQAYGTTQIMLSGGEPMLRLDSIFKILKKARTGTDFWIITSGMGLSEQNAVSLKAAGLTGVMISLDHYNAEGHNRFRGHEKAFEWAIGAALNARKAGLAITLSLCASKEFVNPESLRLYMELAKKLGVAFVQILEPRASGRYAGQQVALSEAQIDLLENLYTEYNNHPDYKDYPIVNYLGYHQRRMGCFGGGNRFFYIDTDGDAHACPFCTGKVCSALEFSAEDAVALLNQGQCHTFEKSVF